MIRASPTVDLHQLARDDQARETKVFTGIVTEVSNTMGYCSISFGALKDGRLYRTSVMARNSRTNKLWSKPLSRGNKLQVKVSKVVVDKDLRKTRITLRIAPQCTSCKAWGHMHAQCTAKGSSKQCRVDKVKAAKPEPKATKPSAGELTVAFVGKFDEPQIKPGPEPEPEAEPKPETKPAAAVLAKWSGFEPTPHFAPCTLFVVGPKARTEKARSEANKFWSRRGKPPAVPTGACKTMASPKDTAKPATASRSAKRRQRKARAKASTRTSASVASVARPNLDAAVAALSQLSEEQLALMITVLHCQKQAQ